MYPVIDAVGRRHKKVTRVVLAKALDRIIHHDGVERPERRRPVLRVAEPKPIFFPFLQLVLEQSVIRIKVTPTLGAFWSLELVRTWEFSPARSCFPPEFFVVNNFAMPEASAVC